MKIALWKSKAYSVVSICEVFPRLLLYLKVFVGNYGNVLEVWGVHDTALFLSKFLRLHGSTALWHSTSQRPYLYGGDRSSLSGFSLKAMRKHLGLLKPRTSVGLSFHKLSGVSWWTKADSGLLTWKRVSSFLSVFKDGYWYNHMVVVLLVDTKSITTLQGTK